VLPAVERTTGVPVLVGGFTAGSIDFSHVLSDKLPVFITIVVLLSALLLFVMLRSLVIPLQAALMNLLSIGGAIGATVAVFQWGWLGSLLGIQKAPIEPWMPVLMFAVAFGLSMDYEVFLISRVREQWVRRRDASAAVGDSITFTGRVIPGRPRRRREEDPPRDDPDALRSGGPSGRRRQAGRQPRHPGIRSISRGLTDSARC
jgi:putative drug exporter of the RND superfamily